MLLLLSYCSCGQLDNSHTDTNKSTSGENQDATAATNNSNTANGSNSSNDSNNDESNSESNESNENNENNECITIGGATPYKIIYETGYSSKANILFEYLKKFDKDSDYTISSDLEHSEEACEILIGLTNREESSQAKSMLSTYLDFSVYISNNKIAIYANNANRLENAIDWFVNTLQLNDDGIAYTTATSYLDIYDDYTYPNLKIANKSINQFSIVIPHDATKLEKNTAISISNWIAENSGYMPTILLDTTTAKPYEIIIGNANRDECSDYTVDNNDKIIYSATLKNGKLLLYANDSSNYNLAIKAFTDGVKQSGGILSALNVKLLDNQENNDDSDDSDNNNDESTENEGNNENSGSNEGGDSNITEPSTPTPDTTPKKAIFIGNSFIYWGGCVTFLKNDDSNESIRQAGGDKGYFNEICKANGLNIDVYNYTYGGKNLNWIYENKLKSKSKAFLDSFDYVFISEAGQNESSFKNTVKKVAALFTNAEEIVYLAHEYTFSTNATNIINALDDLARDGFKIVAWGALVNDVYNGIVTVPNATLTYNKNTFIKNASGSEKMSSNAAVISLSGYGDSLHPNPLSGYITAQMCFSVITGISAIGQKYDFCWDKTIAPQYDLQNFLTYQYGKNQTSNFIEVFNSSADMLGLQTLMDEYIKKYNS